MIGCEKLSLEYGPLRFTAYAAGQGPVVLLLHGFPDLPTTWQQQIYCIADAGFRAVAVTSRGYETSSQPADKNYQLTALADDVAAWLDCLGAKRAHLVGHDWGASIGYAAAARHPQRFYSLCTLAVAHTGRFAEAMASSMKQLWLSRYIMMFQIAGVAERQLSKNDFAYVDTLWQRWSPGWNYTPEFTAHIRHQFNQPGVLDAVLSYYRQGVDSKSPAGQASRQLANSPVTVPTLAIHGEKDGCIDPLIFQKSMHSDDFPAGLEVRSLKNCGHFLHLEQSNEVNSLILDWIVAHE